MIIITLLFNYNSWITTQNQNKIWLMTASGGVPGWAMNQEWHVWKSIHGGFATNTMSTALHDHARQYDNNDACHNKRNDGKLHGNISWNGYGNAIIGSYGGCFEEDIRRFMCDRMYRITRFGCTGKVCTNSQGEKRQCTVPKRLAMMEGWECV